MTIEVLEEYYSIASNIDAIDEEIRTLYIPVASPNGKAGGGHGSEPSNPTEVSAMRIIKLKEILETERSRLYALAEEIETWLQSVDDGEIRSIIRWHYLLRCNWKVTNLKVYGYPDYYYSRKKIERFFKK